MVENVVEDAVEPKPGKNKPPPSAEWMTHKIGEAEQ